MLAMTVLIPLLPLLGFMLLRVLFIVLIIVIRVEFPKKYSDYHCNLASNYFDANSAPCLAELQW